MYNRLTSKIGYYSIIAYYNLLGSIDYNYVACSRPLMAYKIQTNSKHAGV